MSEYNITKLSEKLKAEKETLQAQNKAMYDALKAIKDMTLQAFGNADAITMRMVANDALALVEEA